MWIPSWRPIHQHPKRPQRSSDVLDLDLAHILKGDFHPVADLISCRTGKTDTTWVGKSLKTRRDVDTVSQEVAVLLDDVAEVDTDSKLEPLIFRCIPLAFSRAGLNLHGGTNGVNDATEFNQESVSRRFDNFDHGVRRF